MHELGKFIQGLMDQEGMQPPELARRAGLTRQHVHTLLTGEKLSRLPEVKTFDALCRAFPTVPVEDFLLTAAAAIGLPVGVHDVQPSHDQLSNDALLGILKARLEGGSHDALASQEQKIRPPAGEVGTGSVIEHHQHTRDTGKGAAASNVHPLNPRHQRVLEDAQEVDEAAYDGEPGVRDDDVGEELQGDGSSEPS